MIYFATSIFFIVFALLFLYMGLRGIITKKPFSIPQKYQFYLLATIYLLQILPTLRFPFKYGLFDEDGMFEWFSVLPFFVVLMFSIVLFFLWKTMQGYFFIGVNDDSFRDSLLAVLQELKIPFEERLSKICLTDEDTNIETLVNSWSGVASLKIKDSKKLYILDEVVKGLNEQFSTQSVKTNHTTGIYFTLFGAVFLVFAVGFSIFTWNAESLWEHLS